MITTFFVLLPSIYPSFKNGLHQEVLVCYDPSSKLALYTELLKMPFIRANIIKKKRRV